jgi:hypothetical protein
MNENDGVKKSGSFPQGASVPDGRRAHAKEWRVGGARGLRESGLYMNAKHLS